MILNGDFMPQTQYTFTSLKRFICLKLILENFSTILHSQFNYHTSPVTPFNKCLTLTIPMLILEIKCKNHFYKEKHGYLIHFLSDKFFKGSVGYFCFVNITFNSN